MRITNEEDTLEQKILDKASLAGVPAYGCLELTPLCNFDCKMCYIKIGKEEQESQGKLLSADEWLDIAKDMKKAGVLFVLLTGGEPLLHPEFRRIYREIREMGFIITVNTNGTLIDEDWADFFARYNPRRVNITLYGSDDGVYGNLCGFRGGFDKAVRAARLLIERGVHVKLSGTMVRENAPEIDKMYKIAEEMGAPLMCDTYILPREGRGGEAFDRVRLGPEEAAELNMHIVRNYMDKEAFRRYILQQVSVVLNYSYDERMACSTCLAGRCSFAVNWKGEMKPCVIMDFMTCPVKGEDFDSVWKETAENVTGKRLSEKCANCKLRTICQICPASAYLETGSYDKAPPYLCRYTHRLYELMKEDYDRIMNMGK